MACGVRDSFRKVILEMYGAPHDGLVGPDGVSLSLSLSLSVARKARVKIRAAAIRGE